MKIKDVLEYYGTQYAAAEALGVLQSAVAFWVAKGQVPKLRQFQIEVVTGGDLKVDRKYLK